MPTINERNRILQRGREAKDLLEHPVLSSALQELEDAATEQMKALPSYQAQNVEALWNHIKALRNLKGKLKHYMDQAHNESLAIRQEKEWKQQQRDSHNDY